MLREIVFKDWFTILFIVCLITLAFAKWIHSKRFNEFLTILGNSNYLKIFIKEQKFINYFDGLLFINLIISLVIFIHINVTVFYNDQIDFDFSFFYKLILIVGAIILIKVFVDRLIGSLFEIDELMNDYVFQKITYKNFVGLILFPLNILLIFAIIPSKTILLIIICLLFLVNLTGFITTAITHLRTIKSNFFYFILYLCALEIGPYLILYKVYNGN